MNNRQVDKVSIIVCSCDKFSDTWLPMADSFGEFWPDCSYDTYLMTNFKNFSHERIKPIKIGEDIDWSSNLTKCLDSITSDFVMLWLDDVFLSKKVDQRIIDATMNFMVKKGASFVRLRLNPPPDKWVEENYGEIFATSPFYRVSIFSTIWKRDVLLSLLKKGETPWEFELNGSIRSVEYDGFYCTRFNVFDYIHGVEKGIWKRDAVAWLQSREYDIDFSYRRMMTEREFEKYKKSSIKQNLIYIIPSRYRHVVVRYIQKLYILLGISKKTTF